MKTVNTNHSKTKTTQLKFPPHTKQKSNQNPQ